MPQCISDISTNDLYGKNIDDICGEFSDNYIYVLDNEGKTYRWGDYYPDVICVTDDEDWELYNKKIKNIIIDSIIVFITDDRELYYYSRGAM